MPVRSIVAKPLNWTLTEYGPASSSGTTKSPAEEEVDFRDTPVAVFVTVTIALETTAPDGSVTVPRIRPCEVWPMTNDAEAITNTTAHTSRRKVFTVGSCVPEILCEGRKVNQKQIRDRLQVCRHRPGNELLERNGPSNRNRISSS